MWSSTFPGAEVGRVQHEHAPLLAEAGSPRRDLEAAAGEGACHQPGVIVGNDTSSNVRRTKVGAVVVAIATAAPGRRRR